MSRTSPNARSQRARRYVGARRTGSLVVLATALTAVSAACGPDGPDAYIALVDEAPTTERTLPSTSTIAAGGTTLPSTTEAEVAPNGEVVQVRSLDNSFRMADIEIVAGTEVWWTNNGRNDHNVLPVNEDDSWGVGTEEFTPGDEYRLVFGSPGTYLYYCSIHGTKTAGMVGSVTVVASGG